jgi:PEP-CTERM motif
MKPVKSLLIAIVGSAISVVSSHAQETLNFSSTTGATIQFNGSADSFQLNTSPSGSQWAIGSENGGTGSALGLVGLVGSIPFNYGAISSTTPFPGATLQVANVTGPLGALTINDGAGHLLTGNVNWVQLDTFDFSGGINASLMVNVTGLAYAGSNPDLKTLAGGGPVSMDLTFQFSPGKTLSDLSTGSGSYQTSFSGSISVVPEPASASILLLGLGILACFQRLRIERRF